jgi:hypothetical protein
MVKKKLFLNYSPDDPEDVAMLNHLRLHLGLLKNQLEEWSTDRIIPGEEKESVVNARFSESDAVVHLLSVQFDNTEDCIRLLKKSVDDKKKIVPILLSSFYWQGNPLLANLADELLPSADQPVTSSDNIKKAFSEIVRVVSRNVLGVDTELRIKSDRGFYYALAAIVMAIGVLTCVFVQSTFGLGLLTAIIALMFSCVVLFVLRKILFPTNLSSLP